MGRGSRGPRSTALSSSRFGPGGGRQQKRQGGRKGATGGAERRPRGRQDGPRVFQESPISHKKVVKFVQRGLGTA
eukprot:6738717-Pyramimonas_sp.AAC.1